MSIIERQELSDNIKLLAAQKYIYSKIKYLSGAQIVITLLVSIISVVLIIENPEYKGGVSILNLFIIFVDIFCVTPQVRNWRNSAAKIQELFDTKVLNLDWNEIATGSQPDFEMIHENATKHGLEEAKISHLREWYPTCIGSVPEIFGIIISQRSNVWWDGRLKRKYASRVKFFLILITITLIVYGLCNNKSMLDFFAYIIVPLAPSYVLGYRQIAEHEGAAASLDNLKFFSEKIFADAIEHGNTSELKLKCRALQDQIFAIREKSIPVFDFVFKLHRDKTQELMVKNAEMLVAKVLNLICKS